MNKRKTYSLFIIYAIFLLIASIIPTFGKLNDQSIHFIVEFRLDYIFHSLVYFGFYVLLVLVEVFMKVKYSKKKLVKFIFLTVLIAIFTESLQLFITYRSFNPMDLFSNLVGVFFGITFYLIYYKYFMKVKLANFFKNKNYETANN